MPTTATSADGASSEYKVSARLDGRFVSLVVPTHNDYPEIHRLWTHPDVMFRWRDRGGTRPLEAVGQTLWSGSEIVFIVRSARSGELAGMATCYGYDVYNRHAKFAMAMAPETWGRPHGVEAAALFIDHCFRSLDLRKLYLDVPEFNLPQLEAGLGKYFVQEGCLCNHDYFDGRHWDNYILAIYRSSWNDVARPELDRWLHAATGG